MPEVSTEALTRALKDAAYVTIGLGVMAFQKVQIQRHELSKQFSSQMGEARTQFGAFSKAFEDRVKLVEERLDGVEERIEGLLDEFEERLPEQAKDLAHQARTAAREARGQLRELVARRPSQRNGQPASRRDPAA